MTKMLFLPDFEPLAFADHVTLEVVPGFEVLHSSVVAFGDEAKVVTAFDFVVHPGGTL